LRTSECEEGTKYFSAHQSATDASRAEVVLPYARAPQSDDGYVDRGMRIVTVKEFGWFVENDEGESRVKQAHGRTIARPPRRSCVADNLSDLHIE